MPLLTIGYGSRSVDDVVELLQRHGVRYVIDIRSAPYSRYKPEFSRDALRLRLHHDGITYGFMGVELGGRPDDPSCYDEDGHVDYARCRERQVFQDGIERLRAGWEDGHEIALLCSEGKPENCHRAKLVAPALIDAGVDVVHIDESGDLRTQVEVMNRLDGGQTSLFDGLPPAAATRSRAKYREVDE